MTISDILRDSNFNIVTSGGAIDPSTKKVELSVSWNTPHASSVSTTEYLERHLDNAAKIQTTQADFNGGSHNNTQTVATGGGAVELTQSAGGSADYGNKFIVTATSAVGSMTSSTMRTSLRFTAQSGKTVSAISVYIDSEVGVSPSYSYGIQGDVSGNPSGTYLGSGALKATSAGWKTITLSPAVDITAGAIYHIVVEHNSGAISTSRYVALRRSAPQNLLYAQTQAADSQSNTLFNSGSGWTAQNFQPIYELDFPDATYEGNPYETNAQVNVFGANWIGEKFTVAGGNKTVKDISFYVRQNSATEPADSLQVELRTVTPNAVVSGGSGILATAAQTNTAYNYFTYTFASPITLTNGADYRIVLKSPGSNSTNFYQVYRAVATNAASYNSITYDGTNSVYSASANSGSSWTDANNWDIGGFYFTATGASGYAASGDFTSAALNLGSSAGLNNITWTATVPAGATLRLQVAMSPDIGGPFDYFGADGSLGSFFTTSGPIPLNRINGRYVRYKAVFTSDGAVTPTFSDVSFNYSP